MQQIQKALLVCTLLLYPLVGSSAQIKVGADKVDQIVQITEGKRVGLATNHTGVLSDSKKTLLLDSLISRGVQITKLYSPEHGLRGTADAGAKIESGIDPITKLPIISVYGANRKPKTEHLEGIDVMIYDMQDVGVRFYTYISTLYNLMEACAEHNIPLIVLDRPNPHDAIDGPMLKDMKFRSFVGIIPVPAVHGLTLGEAAQMINGEGWLVDGIKVDLTVTTVEGWRHGDPYSLPIAPSPNLKSDRAIAMYPTTCFFEGTSWSEGRGTETPFEVVGYPDARVGEYSFTPISRPGATKPKHQDKVCYGPDLRDYPLKRGINLPIIIDAAKKSREAGIDFITRGNFFNLLSGTDQFRKQIEEGWNEAQIRASWESDLNAYKQIRCKYLLYEDYPVTE
ncbi:MAG: DUF1343 domain-containing protein [Porphyromonas sp.]|nr:DUF1343 domain-containing protein [Porphyromonas sp.]